MGHWVSYPHWNKCVQRWSRRSWTPCSVFLFLTLCLPALPPPSSGFQYIKSVENYCFYLEQSLTNESLGVNKRWNMPFGSPRRWLVLWTGWSDLIEVLEVAFSHLCACDVQIGRKMEKKEQFHPIEQIAVPSKQMLNISYSYVCKHSNL